MEKQTLSDADLILMASASPSNNSGPVLAMPLAETAPASPIPGGAVEPNDTLNPTDGVVNTTTLPTPPDFDSKALLWVGAGIGTAWLLTRSGGSVSGPKKQNWLVPALILGAGAAWYFFGDKIAAATTPTPATAANNNPTPSGGGGGAAPVSVTDQQKASLLNTYNGNPAQITAINTASAGDIAKWYLLVTIWNGGHPQNYPYTVDVNGSPTSDYNNSLGKWWENFSAKNHF